MAEQRTEQERQREADQTQRIFQVRKTVTEMLVARGYTVPSSEVNEDLQAFKASFGEKPNRTQLMRVATKTMKGTDGQPDSVETVIVFFPEKEKVGAKDIEECVLLFFRGLALELVNVSWSTLFQFPHDLKLSTLYSRSLLRSPASGRSARSVRRVVASSSFNRTSLPLPRLSVLTSVFTRLHLSLFLR